MFVYLYVCWGRYVGVDARMWKEGEKEKRMRDGKTYRRDMMLYVWLGAGPERSIWSWNLQLKCALKNGDGESLL